ncbi:MAG TPA: aminotransferase class I/II-fold pyridoxal phosphate-dependent enzyme [Actinomycetales bacterium]|nr:aminotransferase class I/II-fold pyridoxal phosphate-dependent enzyme [Actinomycetales bacterium]
MTLESTRAVEIVDLTDTELRARGGIKWTMPGPDVLAAWVAESDVAPAPVITAQLHALVDRGDFGYPPVDADTGVPEVFSQFARRRWDWAVDPSRVVLTGDVMAGVLLALTTLCDKAPVVVPTPSYPPFLDVVTLAGLPLVTVPIDPAGPAELDLERIAGALEAGARTVLLSNPHNPWGRAFRRDELEGLRDVVTQHGARVISDEIHAPLVLPGATHVPYASLDGTAGHATTVLSASKAWNLPGLKCAQIVAGDDQDLALLRGVPVIANHGVATPGIAATLAAYGEGEPWLDAWLQRLGDNRDLFTRLVAERLPGVRMRPLEATYLAWLDVRALGFGDADQPNPSEVAVQRGRVLVNDGRTFGPGGDGHVRVNLATSAERIERIVDGLAHAWLD